MKLISHRGNVTGRVPEVENRQDYVDTAIHLGYEVEIDIWLIDRVLFLGHDEPQYEVSQEWLKSRAEKLWIHCKNTLAMELFNTSFAGFNYFWHQEDTITLTSKNFLWVYPGKQPIKNSIAVMPEIYEDNVEHCIGICSDCLHLYERYKQ